MLNIIYYFKGLFFKILIFYCTGCRFNIVQLYYPIFISWKKLAQAIGMGPASFGLKHKFNYNTTQENIKL
jgi:hypothetical protein